MRHEAPGRWRFAKAPAAFIVPELWYQQHFQAATLYFFDPTGRILVPEPVHLPEGDQLATFLVRALLMGPQSSLSQVARSFIPPGLSPAPSVTVSRQGVAQVTLKGPDPGPLPPKTTDLMLAQLAWTLRQEPSVKTFRSPSPAATSPTPRGARRSPSPATVATTPPTAWPAPSSTPCATAASCQGRLPA